MQINRKTITLIFLVATVAPYWALSGLTTQSQSVRHASTSAGNRRLLVQDIDQEVLDFVEKVPRYNLKFEKVNAVFDPTNRNYQESIALTATPWIIYGLLIFIFTIFFCIGRGCCDCCGGRQRREGCCCPTSRPKVYTSRQRNCSKFFMYLLTLIGCCAMALGYWGNSKFSDDTTLFIEAVDDAANTTGSHASSLQSALTQLGADPAMLDTAAQIVNNIDDIRGELASVKDQVEDKYNNYREWGMLAMLAIIMFIMLMGAFGAICNMGNLSFTFVTIIGPLFLLLLAIIGGIHFALLVLSGDFCIQVQDLLADPTATNIPALEEVVQCPSPAEINDLLSDISSSQNTLLSQLNTLCFGGNCVPAYTLSNYANILTDGLLDPANRANAEDAVEHLQLFDTAKDDSEWLLSCTFVRELYTEVNPAICKNLLSDTTYLVICISVFALVMLPAIFLATCGKKRWRTPTADEKMRNHFSNKTGKAEMHNVNDFHTVSQGPDRAATSYRTTKSHSGSMQQQQPYASPMPMVPSTAPAPPTAPPPAYVPYHSGQNVAL